jgi:hypothetical protein
MTSCQWQKEIYIYIYILKFELENICFSYRVNASFFGETGSNVYNNVLVKHKFLSLNFSLHFFQIA